jgi:hypothetical protein
VSSASSASSLQQVQNKQHLQSVAINMSVKQDESVTDNYNERVIFCHKEASNIHNIGVIRSNKGLGKCGYLSCFHATHELNLEPEVFGEMTELDFIDYFFENATKFLHYIKYDNIGHLEQLLLKKKEAIRRRKQTKGGWFTREFFYIISAMLRINIFVYCGPNKRITRRTKEEVSTEQLHCNIYAFLEDGVWMHSVKGCPYPTKRAICIYYSANHYEFVQCRAGIVRMAEMTLNPNYDSDVVEVFDLSCGQISIERKDKEQELMVQNATGTEEKDTKQKSTRVLIERKDKEQELMVQNATGTEERDTKQKSTRRCFYWPYCRYDVKECCGRDQQKCVYYNIFGQKRNELPLNRDGTLADEFYNVKKRFRNELDRRRVNQANALKRCSRVK